jgi:xylulokinase
MEILRDLGINVEMIRVGNDNLFQSSVFSNTISTIMESRIEIVETTGAVGAAKASGVGAGYFNTINEAFKDSKVLHTFHPHSESSAYIEGFQSWKSGLKKIMNHN